MAGVGAASTFTINIELNSQNAAANIASIRSELNKLQNVPGIAQIEKSLAGISTSQVKATQASKGWSQTLASGYRQVLSEDQKYYATALNGNDQLIASREREAKQFSQGLQARLNLEQAEGRLAAQQDKAIGQRDAHVKAFEAYNKQQQVASQQTAIYNKYLYDQEVAQQRFAQGLSTTRYALYDVSSTMRVVGTAMLGLSVATAAVSIAWERDFAQVIRTTDVTGDAVGILRDDLVDLAQTMPVAFGDITAIATLAGQLGVAKERVASFTETVAKFSAVTDLTVEASATAFGRLDALLPDVQGNYEALGSSIAKVGVNSVATESQIVAISTQIASMGNFAGLTAAEVVGLAGALASVGGAPELSRGTVTRLFTQMSRAVSDSGEKLDQFAKIAGVSSAEFAAAFGTDKFGPIFEDFIKNLDDTSITGGNAVATLESLGISSQRDVPLLMKLAGANDVVTKSFSNANSGYESANELNKQYGEIANTTAAKIQVLSNNFQALLDGLGSGALGPLSALLDWAVVFLQRITDLTHTGWGQWVGGIVVAISGLVGILALAASAMTAAFAGMVAMRQALAGLTAQSGVAAISMKGLTAQMAATGTAGKVASVAIKGLGIAMKALSVVGLALILPDIMTWATGVAASARGLDGGFTDSLNRVKKEFSNLKDSAIDNFGAIGATINRATAGADIGISRDIRAVDEALAEMVGSGKAEEARKTFSELRREWLNGGGQLDAFNAYFVDSKKALADYKPPADEAASATNALAAAEEAAAIATEQLATSIGMTPDEMEKLTTSIADGSQAFFDWSGNVKAAYEEGGGGIRQFMATLDEQIVNQQAWATNLQILSSQGATAFVTELARMGPEGQALAADAVNLSAGELMKLEGQARLAAFLASDAFASEFTNNTPMLMEAYRKGGLEAVNALIAAQTSAAPGAVEAVIAKYNLELAARPMKLQADPNGVYRVTEALVAYINSRTATMTITQRVVYTSDVLSGGRGHLVPGAATGGYIQGPGTATSDSVLTRLSNGEYVVRAAAVNKYGTGFMDALNSMKVPKFANGGQVGGSASSAPVMGSVVELGPKSLARLSQTVTNNILLDDVAISRASQRGSAKRRSMGDL